MAFITIEKVFRSRSTYVRVCVGVYDYLFSRESKGGRRLRLRRERLSFLSPPPPGYHVLGLLIDSFI